jgi:hypothetical protein
MYKSYSEMSQIILNRILTPDGTILTSYHVHDYKSHIDKSGKLYGVDGGLSYLKRTGHVDYTELSLYDSEPFNIIRKNLHWGVNMDKDKNILPITLWKPICDLNTDHIQAILDEGFGDDWIREYLKQELEYRK